MSENKKRSDGKPFVDRRNQKAGITSGGRRKADRQLIDIGGKKGKILIAISFGFSACVLLWAFSLPFRGDNGVTFGDNEEKNADVDVRPVSLKPDRHSNDQYVQEMLMLEDDLLRKVAEKNRVRKDLPGNYQAKKAWKRGLAQRVRDAKILAKVAEGEIEKGTIEWHAQQDLKEYLEDVPQ